MTYISKLAVRISISHLRQFFPSAAYNKHWDNMHCRPCRSQLHRRRTCPAHPTALPIQRRTITRASHSRASRRTRCANRAGRSAAALVPANNLIDLVDHGHRLNSCEGKYSITIQLTPGAKLIQLTSDLVGVGTIPTNPVPATVGVGYLHSVPGTVCRVVHNCLRKEDDDAIRVCNGCKDSCNTPQQNSSGCHC